MQAHFNRQDASFFFERPPPLHLVVCLTGGKLHDMASMLAPCSVLCSPSGTHNNRPLRLQIVGLVAASTWR
jgi:hypothetical protein